MKSRFLNLILLLPLFCWAQSITRDLGSVSWKFRKRTDAKWHPATVPGTVHTDLLNNKLIADPFYGANEKQLQWIENEDWEYQCSFTISKEELQNENALLEFDGLDTYAQVFLNGKAVLLADNMFRTWTVDVRQQLNVGKNEIRVVFASAVKKGKEAAKKLSYTLPGDEKIFTRKAQCQYGWDWGPRFVTAGIWKKVQLHFWNAARITSIKCNQRTVTDALARLEFITTVQSDVEGKFQIRVNDRISDIQLKKGLNEVMLAYAIQNPKKWWPNGLGEAYLYPFEVTLFNADVMIDYRKLNIGLRTIELVQQTDKIGESFYFKVNDVPVFMKGANYIPPDSFLPRATSATYKNIVANAVAANMNMLRVWGGGVYADDAFYDECDKNGILVWQDFMFACAMYPGDEAFRDNVKNEVIDNVSRLQNHPCIALWCGNNEVDEGWHNWGWQKQYNYTESDSTKIWSDYKKLFHELIPQTLDQLLSRNENRYWPSSPSIGWGKKESLLQGDSHYWGVWWGMEPFETYRKKVGRFMSEYGFQGMPDIKTFTAFAKREELNFDSEAIKNHQKHPTGYKTIDEYMARDYIVPKKFEDYIYVSQLLQAEGMKTAIEAHRRAKPDCMGTLFWQLNDCWPVTSWSSVDYFGRWKAMQYQVKRSYSPVLVSVLENEVNYDVNVINDEQIPHHIILEQKLMDFDGNVEDGYATEFDIEANSNHVLAATPKDNYKKKSLNQMVLALSCTTTTGKVSKSFYYFAKPKDLQLTKPNIQIKKIDELTYEVQSDVLAKNVFLYSDENVFFSDNFFDIIPNEKVVVRLNKPVKEIKSKSLFDTMQ